MGLDFEMRIDFSMFEAAIEAAVPIALARGAEHVRAVAVSRTPNRTGHLAGSAGVAVHGAGAAAVADVKYPGPYASFQNRGMRWDSSHVIRKRPAGGQTGFLTDTMIDQREAVLAIIADTIRQLS